MYSTIAHVCPIHIQVYHPWVSRCYLSYMMLKAHGSNTVSPKSTHCGCNVHVDLMCIPHGSIVLHVVHPVDLYTSQWSIYTVYCSHHMLHWSYYTSQCLHYTQHWTFDHSTCYLSGTWFWLCLILLTCSLCYLMYIDSHFLIWLSDYQHVNGIFNLSLG